MGNSGEKLKHPDEFYQWMKAKMEVKQLLKQNPSESHRQFYFCHSILIKLHRFFILIVEQLSPEFRKPICIFYLVLRALDTVEDDTSISTDVKVPILSAFHRHIYDPDWHFAYGKGTRYEILMDQFHHVSSAFLELGISYQEVIKDITMRMGAGMAKFICQEVETLDDYDEYCHYVSGLVVIGLSKMFHDNGKECLVPDNLCNSFGLFLQKANIIRDYLEDINEKPKSRMFWPRQIWSKYANKLEDLKYEENSAKALQCLNDMVTNALIHVEDSLKYISELRDPGLMKCLAVTLIMAFGTVALCYNNIEVFRGVVGLRRGLAAKFIYQTKAVEDVYVAFYDFASLLKSKVDMNDPNATLTLSRIDAILKTCQDSGTLNKRKSWKSYIIRTLKFEAKKMGSLGALLKHPDDFYPLLKLKMAVKQAEKQIPPEPHWGFCYSMLHKVSRSFALVIQQLGTELRDAVCIFYLVLRALDTVEDDTSIATEVKVPILMAFHRHIYDRDWHFACGTKEYKVLMDEFHHVSTAFLELGSSYQEAIEDITMRMGAGMAKFICKEVETIDDYDEYCHYVAGLAGLGLSKLCHASGKEILCPDFLSNSMGLFLQKTNIIRDYLEDINEIPKSRMFWPRQIWSKYANKLEELKYEKNSTRAVQCLNDMVTNALIHVEDCLKIMGDLRDPAIFKSCAIPQIMSIGTLALCYNNIEVFRGVVKMRRGLTAKIIDRTKTMTDVYEAFFDFSSMLRSKVDMNDPNATKALSRLDAIQKTCRDSGTLNTRKSYIIESEAKYSSTLIIVFFILLPIIYAYLSMNRPNSPRDFVRTLWWPCHP